MRSLWKGAISFGLVNIPVKLYVATEKKDLKFRYLHRECMTPIQYEKHCPTCNREITSEEIAHGYEYQKGQFVVINEEDLEQLPLEKNRSIDILDFVDIKHVDPIFFDKSYYLEPAEGGFKPYFLLIKAMESTGKTAIARLVIRTKESLAAIRVKEGVLVLATMFFPDELRSPQGLNLPTEQVKIHENETKMAISLVENLSIDFNPEKYHNQYRKALREMVEARIAGKEIAIAPPPTPDNVVDLMEALKQSVKLAEQEREKGRPRKTRSKSSP